MLIINACSTSIASLLLWNRFLWLLLLRVMWRHHDIVVIARTILIMVMFGFAAGVKVMLKSVEDYQKDQASSLAGQKDQAGEPAKEGKENGSRT